jgi:hypothetical protein
MSLVTGHVALIGTWQAKCQMKGNIKVPIRHRGTRQIRWPLVHTLGDLEIRTCFGFGYWNFGFILLVRAALGYFSITDD